jgi:hypothetical protein
MRRLFEHHTGGPVQLADDHAFGAVDDEGAERREQWQLAEVDFLFDLVFDPLLAVGDVLLEHREGQRRLERRRIRHVALDALLNGVLRLAKRIADEVQREVLVDVRDGEQVLEDPFESDVFAIVRGGIQLQQRLEGANLNVEEMGHGHPLLELRERNLLDHINLGSPYDRRKPPRPASRIFSRGGERRNELQM